MSELREKLLQAALENGLDRSPTLASVLSSPDFAGVLTAPQLASILQELGHGDTELLMQDLIPVARVYASARISTYRVGAVAQGASGSLYFGFNMEFPGLTLGDSVHGEQASVVNAWSHGETGIRSIAVSAAPCGHCRQFLYETDGGEHVSVMFPGVQTTLGNLLPSAFGPQDLGLSAGLLGAKPVSLRLVTKHGTGLVAATLEAAQRSYAPYSTGLAAVGIETNDGLTCIGQYAENAAFNPSVSPMQAALVLLRIHGSDPTQIRRVVLVEVGSAVDHASKSRAVLAAAGVTQHLEVHCAVIDGSSPPVADPCPIL